MDWSDHHAEPLDAPGVLDEPLVGDLDQRLEVLPGHGAVLDPVRLPADQALEAQAHGADRDDRRHGV
ncbi:hypothetical protein VP1G_11231 [Cytospora mali]|uniref:Uncharacterized protein n=1 Tax=Cytospora mali TaxID=578113 RepID=A0A194VB58_CYTMA|nr:hypothetical protein VP1G_11231 [Valsa mali var. pyri (nom. inval.)]